MGERGEKEREEVRESGNGQYPTRWLHLSNVLIYGPRHCIDVVMKVMLPALTARIAIIIMIKVIAISSLLLGNIIS